MTKKDNERYATKDDLFILGIFLIVFFFSLFVVSSYNPTLTQLAESEGWEVECIEKETTRLGFWDESGEQIICFNNVKAEFYECGCAEYALRKYE